MIITDKSRLEQECEDATLFEADNIISKLEYELANSKIPGVGLAANQIGIQKRIAIIRGKDKINLVNPVIVEKYDIMEFEQEGCLSFLGSYLLTKRYNEIFVKDTLHPAGLILVGIDAVIVAHEINHLNGKTMFDYEIKRPKVNQKCWCGSEIKYKRCHSRKVIIV